MKTPYDDYCYECTAYGDDYIQNENGEWVKVCDTCPFNDLREEEYDDRE